MSNGNQFDTFETLFPPATPGQSDHPESPSLSSTGGALTMTTFHPFPRLPVELQLRIWETFLAMEHAKRPIIPIDQRRRVHVTQQLRPSALMLVNRQSNTTVQNFYPFTISVIRIDEKSWKPRGSIKLSFELDVFFIAPEWDFDEWVFERAREFMVPSNLPRFVTEPLKKPWARLIKRVFEIETYDAERDVYRLGKTSPRVYENRNWKGLGRCFLLMDDVHQKKTLRRYRDVRSMSSGDYLRKDKKNIVVMERLCGSVEEGKEVKGEWKDVLDGAAPTDGQISEFLGY
ncbi:hypothetical protein GGR57DRAFT_512074 [Xylariaceae sp. FL1272]|nr:hypothetical protein GGR57DRAFT_512074 [Xylariaceae sp. FL1272]